MRERVNGGRGQGERTTHGLHRRGLSAVAVSRSLATCSTACCCTGGDWNEADSKPLVLLLPGQLLQLAARWPSRASSTACNCSVI